MRLRVAACQLSTELGNIAENLRRSERLALEALDKRAKVVVLPEFFPSGMGYDSALENCALPLEGPALELMKSLASRHLAVVGGSFVSIRGEDRFNTFAIVQPDGSFATHDKDIPTFWEGCYYTGGREEEGPAVVDGTRIGAAMCWELIRSATARRMQGRVDLVMAGSCWPTRGESWLVDALYPKFVAQNEAVARAAPAAIARLVGAPVVHAGQSGPLRMRIPLSPLTWEGWFAGESQVCAADGTVLARRSREEGEGIVIAEVQVGAQQPRDHIPDQFWTTDRPAPMPLMWKVFNAHAARVYARSRTRAASGR